MQSRDSKEEKIEIYSLVGEYVFGDEKNYFQMEMEVLKGLNPFVILQHDFNDLMEIPLTGLLYEYNSKKKLFLHNDINDSGDISLVYDLTCNNSLEGILKGFVLTANVDMLYQTLSRIILGENLYLSFKKQKIPFVEYVKMPVSGHIKKLYEI